MSEYVRKKSFLVNFVNRANDRGVKNNPSDFVFFDTETKQETKEKKIGHKKYKTCINTLQMGWACYWHKEEGKQTVEWFYFETIKDFQAWLNSIIVKTKKKQLWIIAHNIVFDALITDMFSFLKSKKYESKFIHSKGMVFLQKFVKSKKKKVKKKNDDGTTTIKEVNCTQKIIMLVNNGNIFPAPLKTIGETVDLPKLKVDFAEDSKEYVKIYCKRDVEILLKFWQDWSLFIETYGLGKLKFTISSQSMEAFRKKFCNAYIVLDDDMKNLEFERKSYYGGRTEIFYKGKIRKPINYFDVNSLYPSVMINNKFPTEFKFAKINPRLDDVEYYINKGFLVIAECFINTKRNCYPVKNNSTLLFPIGKFKTYLATPEVIEGLRNKDIEKFGRVSFYKGENIFHDYVEFFYNERLKKKAEGNKQEKMLKLFLNSLYGKFGMMSDNWENTTEDEVRQLDQNFSFDGWIMDEYKIPKIIIMGDDVTPHLRYIGETLQISCEKLESNISFPAIASHVTSYARLVLWRVIEYCQQHNIKYYYCDTDSIFTEKEIAKELVDSKELGKFKLEKYFEYGVEFINLKNYCKLDKDGNKFVENDKEEKIIFNDEIFNKESKILKGKEWKMKGVSNNSEIIDENTFIVQEWGGLPKQEYYKKFGRKAGEYWVIYKTKKNHGTINKGNLQIDGNITPFNMEEF